MSLTYDSRLVPAHDKNKRSASVLLMNEAPGPSEAKSSIPSFGRQGGNIFHALRRAGIEWAVNHPNFCWPANGTAEQSLRHSQKADFLKTRGDHITCTNSFPCWPKPTPTSCKFCPDKKCVTFCNACGPKPTPTSCKFCPPRDADVLCEQNLARIRLEIHSNHRVILICGKFAYLACVGRSLSNPSDREGTQLDQGEMDELNQRLAYRFEKAWYMGHTRRWSFRWNETISTLRCVSQFVGWSLLASEV